MEVGTRIRDLLTDRDIKHKVICNDLGINVSSFSNYITNATRIPYGVLVQVADYLYVSTDFLLGRTESREPSLSLDGEEQALVRDFRRLHRADRDFIVQSIRVMLEK